MLLTILCCTPEILYTDDGEFYDSSNTFMMQLYDVGMSSMVVQEAYALAELADAIGRNEGPMLKNRGDSLSKLIAEYLWDEESQICKGARDRLTCNHSLHSAIERS